MHHNHFVQYLLAHKRAFQRACVEFVHAPMSNMFTVLMIGIILALPLCFFVLLQNAQHLNKTWQITAPAISLYLKENISAATAENMLNKIRENDAVENAVYVSPETGLADFEKNTPFAEINRLFDHNPIPGVIIVTPTIQHRTPDNMQLLFNTLKVLPNVDLAQLDADWATHLYNMLSVSHKIVELLSIIFAAGIAFIIGHTLNSQLTRHLQEVRVLRLIGASNMFIRRPLLHSGILYGLLGGIVAWLIVLFLISLLQPTVSTLAKSYDSSFQLTALSVEQGVLLLLSAALLGLLSAFCISSYFLHLPESDT